MTRSEKIIWLAGLLEAEGCFLQSPQPRILLQMSDLDVIDRAKNSFMGAPTIGISKPKIEHHCIMYRYQWNGVVAKNLMELIAPFMLQRRQAKISSILGAQISSKTPQEKNLLVWASGVFEGEGCFYVLKDRRIGRRPRLRAQIRMTDRDVIERIISLFALSGSINVSRPPSMPKHYKTQYIAQWNSANAEKVMRAVLPYMGERRAAKIRECLKTPNLSHRKATA